MKKKISVHRSMLSCIVNFILCAVVIISLAACGDDTITDHNISNTVDREEEQKEQIVIGCMYNNQQLQTDVVAFNTANDKYEIIIKNYMDVDNWSVALTNLNNDIISGTNCPDIFDLSQIGEQELAAKGVLEDLYPYLEESSVLSRDSFVGNILDNFTYDGRLICIPSRFSIDTIVGKSSVVGNEMGWSVEDMIACAREYPDAQLFSDTSLMSTRSSALFYIMAFNKDLFVDWENGECHFDSAEFKDILEFVKTSFPDNSQMSSGGILNFDGQVEQMRQDKLLLETVSLNDFQNIQEYPAKFDAPVTFVGYPTTDGSPGCLLAVNTLYGISSRSQHKDGAWEFIENHITSAAGASRLSSPGFPALKELFEQGIEEAVKVEYATDENGELLLDFDGEPIVITNSSNGIIGDISYDDWKYTFHTPTKEETDQLRALIAGVRSISGRGNDVISDIVLEEADAYFQGQRSIDEVVDVIQNRTQTYVSENG